MVKIEEINKIKEEMAEAGWISGSVAATGEAAVSGGPASVRDIIRRLDEISARLDTMNAEKQAREAAERAQAQAQDSAGPLPNRRAAAKYAG